MMEKLGEILDKEGNVSRVLYYDSSDDKYRICELDKKGNEVNSIELNQEEFEKLHMAMSKIENYQAIVKEETLRNIRRVFSY